MIEIAGCRYLNFAANDYLGLAAHPTVRAAAQAAIEVEAWGTSASPLITGRRAAHHVLEQRLARFEGTEAALLFPTGFAANLGTISALMGPEDVIFSDAHNHASIIDGCRLSRATVHIYRHCDAQHLQSLLAEVPAGRRRLIVTDSLFSMDGDFAPLVEIVELAQRYQAMLMIDEAHATGVFGDEGRGLAEHLGVHESIDIHVGTLSKALGSVGGFVAGSSALIELLVNRARSYIFSTATPAATCAAATAALDVVSVDRAGRERLVQKAAHVRQALVSQGWDLGGSTSQIIPLVIGAEATTLEFARRLHAQGLWVSAIRPPSVAPGQSRLRICVSAAHTDAMLTQLVAGLAQLGPLVPGIAAQTGAGHQSQAAAVS